MTIDDHDQSDTPALRPPPASGADGGNSHASANVLLVEDSPADAELTLIAIRQARPEVAVHVVGTADEALAFLHQDGRFAEAPRPDLILLDLNLPGRDGTEVAAIITADDALRTIPIIMLSNSNSELDVLAAYQSGANAYLVKPMEYADIREALSVLLAFWLQWACLPVGPPECGEEAGTPAAEHQLVDTLISPFSPVPPLGANGAAKAG